MTDVLAPMSRPGVAGSWADAVAAAITQAAGADTWKLGTDTHWIAAQPPGDAAGAAATPAQGWKLHVSAAVHNANDVLAAALPPLIAERVAFKVAADPAALAELNGGGAGWSQVGKFLTAYSHDDAHAVRLAVALDAATSDLVGPRIPSDRPLRPRSLVHYRYGAFTPRWRQGPLGELESTLIDPTGNAAPDQRGSVYVQPAWVDDPFRAAGVAVPLPAPSLLLHGRYLVGATLDHRPSATVFLCADLDAGRRCVIKRVAVDDGVIAPRAKRAAVDGELAMLERLQGVAGLPQLYDVIRTDEHVLIVMEQMPGTSLEALVSDRVRRGRQPDWDESRRWFSDLAVALGELHCRGFTHSDLKPPHVFVRADGIGLIDAESIGPIDGGTSYLSTATPGYASPQQLAGERPGPGDAIYAFGALLYFALTGCEPSHAPDRRDLLARPLELAAPGAPADLCEVVRICLDHDPDRRTLRFGPNGFHLDAPRRGHTSAAPAAALGHRVATTARTAPATLAAADGSPTSAPPTTNPATAVPTAVATEVLGRLLDDAHRELHAGGGLTWRDADEDASSPTRRDLGVGSAGVVHALATVAASTGAARITDAHRARLATTVAAGATALIAERTHDVELPGLYVGAAGRALAAHAAGQALGDEQLCTAALRLATASGGLAHRSPDLYNGTAGRLLVHLQLWRSTGASEQLDLARSAADRLLADAEWRSADDVLVRWTIPEGYGAASGQSYLGYAHGTAGIGAALAGIEAATGARLTGDPVAACVETLRATAVVGDDGTARWPASPTEPVSEPLWCHGSAGIARFLIAIVAARPDLGVDGLLTGALAATAMTRHLGPSQCHGLAGNIEVLIDGAAALGERWPLDAARQLGALLAAQCTPGDDLEPPSPGALRTNSLLLGRAGVLRALVRLADPGALAPLP